MDETNIIKSIVESTCPHCGKQVYVESQFHPATIGGIFTKEKMNEAKEDLIMRIEALSIDEEKKENIIKWVKNPDTIFSPWETDSIINSILKPE